jgi:integrase
MRNVRSANRYLALVRAVVKRAADPWQWIEKAPSVTLYPEAKRRARWLNKEEATRLLDALSTHQQQLTRFALATGLRQANMLGLKWSDVDMKRRTAWVHADEAKGGEAIGVPLNDEAMAVLREEFGKYRLRVFMFKGRPVAQANTRAWRNAFKRAGIKNFRWHDLRHVWATWHVMAGITMAELQELGAWKSAEMVRRYAHFAPEQLRAAADKLVTLSYTPPKSETREATQAIEYLAPRPGLEPGTVVALSRAYERSEFSGSIFSLSTIRHSSASEPALTFRIMLLRWTFTVVSVMPISPAICLFNRPCAT